MENVAEFQRWLSQMLKDSKEKLGMTDETLADLLLREGLRYYTKVKVKCETCSFKYH